MKKPDLTRRATRLNQPVLLPFIDDIDRVGRSTHQSSSHGDAWQENVRASLESYSLNNPDSPKSSASSATTVKPNFIQISPPASDIPPLNRLLTPSKYRIKSSREEVLISPTASIPILSRHQDFSPSDKSEIESPGPALPGALPSKFRYQEIMSRSGSKGKGREGAGAQEDVELSFLREQNAEQKDEINQLKIMMKELLERTVPSPHRGQDEERQAPLSSNEDVQSAIVPGRRQVKARDLRVADGPKYTGPSQVPGPLIRWIDSIEHFYLTQDLEIDREKIVFAGNLLEEITAKDFYFSNLNEFLNGTWSFFISELKAKCLKPFWQKDIMSQIQKLEMSTSEDFGSYCLRARSLQREVGRHECSDLLLAQFLELGLPDPFLKAMRRSRAIMIEPFNFMQYSTTCEEEYQYLVSIGVIRRSRLTFPLANQRLNSSIPKRVTESSSNLERFKAFCAKEGICSWCRTKCGSAPGNCPGKRSWARLNIPVVTSSRPIGPAMGGPNNSRTPGAPVAPPAGRPFQSKNRATGINNINEFPDLGSEDSAMLENLASIMTNENGLEEGRDKSYVRKSSS